MKIDKTIDITSVDTFQKIYFGNIHGEHIHDDYAGAVFDIHGLAPALTTMSGGG